ncbi:Imidazoleglycerol-phosphate dehydratase [hydrothermal vent metagenome]|uniref:Imidazoleglycerol-phosphate dehydratase n=1 Tax=hydrothermal vent metagenome TaxID=652676 RepID=A0A3B1CH40_9ZZZZ
MIDRKMSRKARVERKTKETSIEVELDLDGRGAGLIDTGIPFLDHMLDHLSKHSLIDIDLKATGDLEIDGHHTTEDVGLCLGQALSEALGEKRGIVRYGYASIPMNEALVDVSLDISGRPFCVFDSERLAGKVGDFDAELAEEFLRALANKAGLTVHVTVKRGSNIHHIIEAMFKALARALGQAVRLDPRIEGAIPSTKETL